MRKKPDSSPEERSGSNSLREEIEERIRTMRLQALKGAWGLVLFVIVSVLAIPGFRALPSLPEKARQILGAPPKVEWISLALVVYVFSALTLTLARITQGSGAYRGWSHVFYITCFYFFFAFTEVTRESFWAVFVSGLIILGLENFAIRSYYSEMIEDEQERLERMKK
jgi:hypothetical protein